MISTYVVGGTSNYITAYNSQIPSLPSLAQVFITLAENTHTYMTYIRNT